MILNLSSVRLCFGFKFDQSDLVIIKRKMYTGNEEVHEIGLLRPAFILHPTFEFRNILDLEGSNFCYEIALVESN